LRVLVGALALFAVFAALYPLVGDRFVDRFSIPNTESQRLTDLLNERFPETAGDSATVVVRTPVGFEEADALSRLQSLLDDLRGLPDVVSVSSPLEQQGAISADGSIGRISVQYAKRSFELERSSAEALLELRAEYSSAEFQVEAGGSVVRRAERERPGRSELIGLASAVVILLVAFGSVVAMGLPIVTAILALVSGFFLISVGAAFLDMPSFTPQFAAMIGIGVGIDYALLVVTRFREGLNLKLSVEDAVAKASATAGRSVLFAGSTVVIALLGLWTVGIPTLALAATAAAGVVGVSALVAVGVLPALLAVVGTRIDRWRVPGRAAAGHDSETGFGYRLSRAIQRAPLVWLIVSLAILLVLAVPVSRMRLGAADAGNNPTSLTSRRAYDLLSEAFGPGFNGAILVAVRIDDPEAVQAVERLPLAIQEVKGIAAVSAPRYNAERSAAVITVIPATAPQSAETSALVHNLRDMIPKAIQGADAEAVVGGSTATFIDVGDKIESRMPLFFAAVIGLSFVLLTAVFRSLVVPLKAAVMNILSLGAAYGVVVAVFQWGWLGGLVGVHREGPIESFLPMMLFAVLFGLSMDYEVFLVSRIREGYLETGNNAESVARGLSVTTRVITAAAAIMVAVFLSFALSDQRVIKEFGVGLAMAILLDATLVRLMLVPSVMHLFGDANWWLPWWLDRFIPRIGIESEPARSVQIESTD
jgi:RND superfamily putative drug exporter